MNQLSAKKLIEETNYLDNKILVFKSDDKNKFCKIVWKGYSATTKDENNEDGTVRVRLKDLLSGKEFSEDMKQVSSIFPKESILNKENSKAEILNIIHQAENENNKTLEWIAKSFDTKQVVEEEVEQLLTELWLESKVTKARFKSNDIVVYNLKK
jgi:hypothetical protein